MNNTTKELLSIFTGLIVVLSLWTLLQTQFLEPKKEHVSTETTKTHLSHSTQEVVVKTEIKTIETPKVEVMEVVKTEVKAVETPKVEVIETEVTTVQALEEARESVINEAEKARSIALEAVGR